MRLRRAIGSTLTSALVAATFAVPALGFAGVAEARPGPAHPPAARGLLDPLAAVTTPVIAGTGAVGSPLALTMPTWNLPGVTSSVQWLSNGAPIPGATGGSYVPVVSDAGSVVMAQVTGTLLGQLPVDTFSNAIPIPADPGGGGGGGGGGTDPGTDALTLLSVLDLPATAEVGQLITFTEPLWSLPGVRTTYQWLRDGAPIPGADHPSYVPTLDDAGHQLRVQVNGFLSGLPLVTETSDALGIPLAPNPAVTPAGDVTVTGPKKVGTRLALQGPTWNPADATNKYQWLRDDAPIAGATLATYDLTALDLGHAIAVKVTGHKDGFTDATITSATVTPLVGDPITYVTKPTASGTGKVGRLLTAAPGTWTGGTEGGAEPAFGYQWQRNGVAIPGAVGQQYQVQGVDAGKDLSVVVTATRPAYRPGSFTTANIHVAKLASTLSASLAKSTIRKGSAAVMKLALKVPGLAKPAGAVRIMDGSKVLKKVRLTSGKASVRLTKLKPGLHKLRAVYAGTAAVSGSRSRVLKLTVKK
ncbi:Ig-like domain repeat protein [Nocardioides sp. LS1]|uniref:Ig-like domain repeat protein n=1 Tax=Nocardioides sp. LS1 TaxID=1027620 RepID=UPI000F627630|nr:Ig-like domain repeat protein [Nocardioides sp. LS1]GCD89802.1 hypothetical protein NLS1_18080 [Nocardioides sp. LS1]